jgi:hypothetical protein
VPPTDGNGRLTVREHPLNPPTDLAARPYRYGPRAPTPAWTVSHARPPGRTPTHDAAGDTLERGFARDAEREAERDLSVEIAAEELESAPPPTSVFGFDDHDRGEHADPDIGWNLPILEAAVRDRYDPERAATEKQLVLRELKTLRREVLQVGAGNKVLFEALGLLVRNLFSSLTPPTADARLVGDQFFARFVDAVASAIENDDALMDRVLSLAVVRHDGMPSEPEETTND